MFSKVNVVRNYSRAKLMPRFFQCKAKSVFFFFSQLDPIKISESTSNLTNAFINKTTTQYTCQHVPFLYLVLSS